MDLEIKEKQNNFKYEIVPSTKYVDIGNILKKDITARYHLPINRPVKYQNLVIDNYLLKYSHTFTWMKPLQIEQIIKKFPNSSYTISRWLGKLFSVPYISIEDLFLMHGYKLKDLKQLLVSVKRKRIPITLVGMGGFGHNFVYILLELCKLTNTYGIFSKLNILDPDTTEFSNLLRFMSHKPLDNYNIDNLLCYPSDDFVVAYHSSVYKVDIFLPNELRLLVGNGSVKTFKKEFVRSVLVMDNFPHTLFIGSPNISTRNLLYNLMNNGSIEGFLCPLHHNYDMYLWANPRVIPELQLESYGRIDIEAFFLNMVGITIKILESIKDESYKKLDTLLASLTPDTISMSKTSRKYNIIFEKDMG